MKSAFYLNLSFLILFSITQGNSQISLDQIWVNLEYSTESVPGFNFMNDGNHYTRLQNNKITKYDLLTGESKGVLFNGLEFKNVGSYNGEISSYRFSKDENFIIIESAKESIYRRSSKAYFYIYNRKTKTLKNVRKGEKVMYGKLSPDGKKVAYVFKNNIYYKSLDSQQTFQVTNDGEKNKIINGAADWVYEEEFSMSKAFFWSNDSKKIAYQRFDETEVSEFTLTKYNNELYPEYLTFKYPKVGENNSIVSIHIYNIESEKVIQIDLGPNQDIYIPRIFWTNDPNQLFVYKLNRHQNHLMVYSVNAITGELQQVIDERSAYYIEISDDIRFLSNNSQFVWSSEKSGYNHYYIYDMNGKEVSALTSGNYDVTKFYGIDEKNNIAYYQSAEKSPLERHLYRVDLNGGGKQMITKGSGTFSAQFSSTFNYYVSELSTINSPSVYKVFDRNSKLIRILEDNSKLKEKQLIKATQAVEFFKFETSESVSLNGYMIKPSNMIQGKKYPVFMYVYGGPGSQNVTNSWKGQNYWWFQMLAQNGYIVVCVDNRGTGARGEEFKKMTYLNLGHYETIDQIETAKYLGNLDYVDDKRIGIFGWSYGGYVSSLCILKGNDVFKAAIAVAPVTNWRWYDTIYTERFMRTEEENAEGYNKNSPVNLVDRLKGSYLLVHGMGDDNVHFQHTAEMANALIKANKQYDTYFYPNRTHGISGGTTRLHLYTKMTDFIYENL